MFPYFIVLFLYAALAATSLVVGIVRKSRRGVVSGTVGLGVAALSLVFYFVWYSPFWVLHIVHPVLSPMPDAALNTWEFSSSEVLGPFAWILAVVEWAAFIAMWALPIWGLVGTFAAKREVVTEPEPALAYAGGHASSATPSDAAPVAVATGQSNGLALASIIVVWFSSIIGLVLGHVALSQIKKTGQEGRGMALTAVIVGWVFTAFALITFVIIGVVYASAFSMGSY